MKSFRFIFTWTTLLILMEPYHDTSGSSFHDVLYQKREKDNENLRLSMTYDGMQRLVKRFTDGGNVYRPIRISTVYSFNQHLLLEEQAAAKQVIDRAVRKIASLFSVIHVEGPLLLTRNDACPASIRKGINKGKCARIQKGYTGEKCLDNFRIPSAHLKGFAVYNLTSPDPEKIYAEDGPGLANTDFVLYVTADITPLCNPYKTSALAYAAYCQLDSTGRPVAGQVNFCPRTLKAQKFDEELLYKTAIHELFHALGFSNKLFDKYRNCNDDGVCQSWPQPIAKPVEGITRLVTSTVVSQMTNHFNCTTEPEFGGPLETMMEKVTSHWNSLIMHSSIMGSKEQKPYVTLIDPISLAVFEDSGWYKVNYSSADKFIWGQNQGCHFGLPDFCQTQQGFCTRNVTGCHHLRLSKARCNVNTNDTSSCGVFAADQRPCFLTPHTYSAAPEEIFSSSSRCFLSSLLPADSPQSGEMTGKCYERKCEEDNYYIRVKNGEWLLCQPGSYIQVEDFEGQVECPSYEEICSQFIQPEPSVELSTPPITIILEETLSTERELPTTVPSSACTSPCKTTHEGSNSSTTLAEELLSLTVLVPFIAAVIRGCSH